MKKSIALPLSFQATCLKFYQSVIGTNWNIHQVTKFLL